MKFVLQPSLEHIALVKIGISLWNQNDVRALISRLSFDDLDSSDEWKKIEKRVTEKVPQVSLPHLLKEKVLGCIKPIGLQMRGWIEFHFRDFHLCVTVPAEFCWTPYGTVDRKKTAEVLVRDENLEISTRYKLACTYCLEGDILQLWNCLPNFLRESNWAYPPIISFWSRYMMRMRLGSAHIDCRSEFEYCAIWGNKIAVEYFLQKLTPRDREKSLVKAAKTVYEADVLCFLLSQMNEEQQVEVFKHNPCRMLKFFLQWPLQSFFIEIANCMWDFLSKKDYDNLLIDIIRNDRDGYKDCNYQKLFTEFWQESSNAFKSFVREEFVESSVVPYLYCIKDKENFRLILKDTTPTVKEKLVYRGKMFYVFQYDIYHNEWDLLEFCIRECLPSKKAMLKFKEEFEMRWMPSYFKKYFATKKTGMGSIFHLFDDSICKYDKRSVNS